MQVVAASAFWASGTFWTAVAVLTSAMIGVGAMWATLRAAHPKRRIAYDIEATAIESPHHALGGILELRRDGVTLSNPHIVRVDIKNTGRRDIASSSFDNSSPIRIGVGAPVLDVLNTGSTPVETQAPAYEVVGHELHIKPGRIGKGALATYTLLVNGAPRTSFASPLIDVQIVRGINGDWEDRLDNWVDRIPFPAQILLGITVAVLALAGIGLLLGDAGQIDFQFDIDKD
ncbi:hypothetical protein AB0M28_22845 [Streptomyces sp. NPDC051940]|uniref:hypothetical protein n=1 Tax=Streptomyces sp. NPDC051940 TaxID=3155675 RepID=UPI00344A80CE